MRPTSVESIRGIQAALAETVAPELRSAFAQSVLQVVQMLLESLAAEWDTEAEDIYRDNRSLLALLSQFAEGIRALPGINIPLGFLVTEIEGVSKEPAEPSLAASALNARNNELMAILEQVLAAIEDVIEQPAFASLAPIRRAAYGHLRAIAVRGWSFWDAASFRERIAREKSA